MVQLALPMTSWSMLESLFDESYEKDGEYGLHPGQVTIPISHFAKMGLSGDAFRISGCFPLMRRDGSVLVTERSSCFPNAIYVGLTYMPVSLSLPYIGSTCPF